MHRNPPRAAADPAGDHPRSGDDHSESDCPRPGPSLCHRRRLAEDLRRFLDDRSILARRATVWEQTARWCRRNKVIAALAALLAFSMIAGTVLSMAFALHARDESRRANKAASLATQEAVRAGQESVRERASRRGQAPRDWSERLRYLAEVNLAQRRLGRRRRDARAKPTRGPGPEEPR